MVLLKWKPVNKALRITLAVVNPPVGGGGGAKHSSGSGTSDLKSHYGADCGEDYCSRPGAARGADVAVACVMRKSVRQATSKNS